MPHQGWGWGWGVSGGEGHFICWVLFIYIYIYICHIDLYSVRVRPSFDPIWEKYVHEPNFNCLEMAHAFSSIRKTAYQHLIYTKNNKNQITTSHFTKIIKHDQKGPSFVLWENLILFNGRQTWIPMLKTWNINCLGFYK